MTFVELCEEFSAKYGIDALGMSILNIKKHISTDSVLILQWTKRKDVMKPSKTTKQERIHGLDAYRAVLMMLGVVLHGAEPFLNFIVDKLYNFTRININ